MAVADKLIQDKLEDGMFPFQRERIYRHQASRSKSFLMILNKDPLMRLYVGISGRLSEPNEGG